MKVAHKILPPGFHFVKSLEHHHLFAQWPVERAATINDASCSGNPPQWFVDAANKIAGFTKKDD